jgi:ABC-type polysaccharide/polyol phosphate export permease
MMDISRIRNDLAFFFERKDLLKQIVISKLIVGQKDLMLGYLWWILEPLLWTLIYWLLVNKILQRGGDDYHIFILCGIIPFRAFLLSFTQSLTAVSQNITLISQLHFPRLYLALADVIVNHIKLLFGFFIIAAFIQLSGGTVGYRAVFILVPFFFQLLLLCGTAMIFSILGIYYQDLKFLTQFVGRALLYVTPILYSLERIPENYQSLYLILNPMAPLILSYRDVFIMNRFPETQYLVIIGVESLMLMVLGFLYFSKNEKRIVKYL